MDIIDIKKIFIQYNCSAFAVAREDMVAYEEYKKIYNHDELLKEWRRELFESYVDELKREGSIDIFLKVYDLVDGAFNGHIMQIFRSIVHDVKVRDGKEAVILAETIIGRKDISERSGLIFGAYDLGDIELAEEFVRFTEQLLNIECVNKNVHNRINRAKTKVLLVKKALKM